MNTLGNKVYKPKTVVIFFGNGKLQVFCLEGTKALRHVNQKFCHRAYRSAASIYLQQRKFCVLIIYL